MFQRKSFSGLKKAAAVFLSVCMLVSLFTCLTVITAVADEPTATETAAFIGRTGSEKQAEIFIPVDIKHPEEDANLFSGEEFFKVSFKCKMLSGTKPVVGVYDLDDSNNKAWARADWCDQNSVVVENGVCTARIKVNFHRRANPNSQGNRSFYLVIGNSYYNGSATEYGDFEDAFILSDVKLFWYDPDEDEYDETLNYLPEFTSANINFKGTYFFKNDGCDNWDSPLGADAMKWHIMAAPAYIKQITVPADYNTADAYNAENFVKFDETDYTREYYTNAAYEGKYFAALKYGNDAGFEIISSDINKKMVIIDANHEGEEDYNLGTGNEKAPTYNRAANIFLPISYGQYGMTGGKAPDIDYLVKITFKAVRLEGDSTPVIGRIVGKKGKSSGKGSQALCKAAYNIPIGDYASNAATYNETYKDAEGNRLMFTYDEATGDFTGYMRVRCADNDYSSRWGCNEVITIGNAEHVWAAGGKFDSTSFNSSFAISDIKVDLYACGSGYVIGDLVAEDIAPHLYADTLDTTSRWAYQFRDDDGRDCSNSDYDCIRAPQNLWSAEGNVGMVHTENLTPCMAAGHTVTHHAAAEGTREYWSCSCGKNFADAYCKTEITDLTANARKIHIAASENPATAFIPLKLSGYEGNRWFKFTCKAELIGGESIPVVSTLYNVYNGSNQCETTAVGSNDSDMAVIDYSYDAETQTLTAYIKCWIKDSINKKDRYPFERMNAVSGNNMAILLGNGRYIGSGYTEQSTDTGFVFSEPELYMLSCTGGSSAIEEAKTAEIVSENLITPMTDKTIDFESEYVATWTNYNNPLCAPTGKWYRTGKDKANVTAGTSGDYTGGEEPVCDHTGGTATCHSKAICELCGKEYGELDPNNHDGETEVRDALDATCTEAGYTGDTYCLGCGAKIADGEVIPALGHTGGTATCHSKAVCTRCQQEYGELDPNNHDGETEVRDAKDATCTEAGYTGDTYCLGCGAKIAEGEEIAATGHSVGDWLSDESDHWHVCESCSAELDKAAHTASDWIVDTEATTTAAGHQHKECTVCGKVLEEEDIPKLIAHTPGDINGDGELNNKDLTRFFQYLSDWDVEVNEDALDVNGDGSVNNKDLTRLFQYLSDWDVEIF